MSGAGIPRYSNAKFTGYDLPTKVGARYFPPEPDYDPNTDQPVPMAMGNRYDGGQAAYQERVYDAAEKDGKKLGLSRSDIRALKPRKVA